MTAHLSSPPPPPAGPGARTRRAARVWAAFTHAPTYPPSDADRRTFRLVGLELPLRATTALALATFLVTLDYTRTAIPAAIQLIGRDPAAIRYQAIERVVLFGLVPLLVVVFAFRDRPSAYGLRLGDWRWGLGLAGAGALLMTPIIVALAGDPGFRGYYTIVSAPPVYVAITNILDLVPTEFILRGFLMFALIRWMGPVGVVVAQMPFIFSHLGKPEPEVYSTLFGGMVFGWLNWRTGSIIWSAAAHVYILTLMVVLAGG